MIRHTRLERRVIELSRDLARAHAALEEREGVSHPSHARDVADGIHAVQRVVAIRLARRADPGLWGVPPS